MVNCKSRSCNAQKCKLSDHRLPSSKFVHGECCYLIWNRMYKFWVTKLAHIYTLNIKAYYMEYFDWKIKKILKYFVITFYSILWYLWILCAVKILNTFVLYVAFIYQFLLSILRDLCFLKYKYVLLSLTRPVLFIYTI